MGSSSDTDDVLQVQADVLLQDEVCENRDFSAESSPMAETIVYEQPLNERVRSLLRLEKLFQKFAYHIKHDSYWNNNCCLDALLELLGFTTRSDVKLEVLKELERQHGRLESLAQRPQVDHSQLESILRNLKSRIQEMQAPAGQIGKELQEIELMCAVKQKMNLPGVICDFDLPAFRFWQSHDPATRKKQLQYWYEPFKDLDRAMQLILDVIRHSAQETEETGESGFFQQSLTGNQSILLLRIILPEGSDFYPGISGGKHRFSVRFLRNADPTNRPDQVESDVYFKLQMCAI